MKYFFLFIFSLTFLIGTSQNNLFPQDKEVVQSTSVISKTGNGFQIEINLNIDSLWIVYDSIAGEGPIPFSIQFETLDNFKVVSISKPVLHEKYDEIFETDIFYLKGHNKYLIQLEKIDTNKLSSVSGSFEFMSCNLSTGVCLPPVNNSFDFRGK